MITTRSESSSCDHRWKAMVSLRGHLWIHPSTLQRVEALVAGLDPPTTVEVGAGDGIPLFALGPSCLRDGSVGVDPCPATLRHARNHSDRAQLLAASTAALPVRDGCASMVLLRPVTRGPADRDATLAEARRILRPGGLLASTTLDDEALEVFDTARQEASARVLGHRPAVLPLLHPAGDLVGPLRAAGFVLLASEAWSGLIELPNVTVAMQLYRALGGSCPTPVGHGDPHLQDRLDLAAQETFQRRVDSSGHLVIPISGRVLLVAKEA